MNPLLRVLLGSGKLPDELRAALVAEQPVLLEEGLTGSVTYRRYRAPGEWASYEKKSVVGAVVVTPRRVVVWAGRFKHVDVPLNHQLLASIEVKAETPDRVSFAYDAGRTNPAKSGQVEVRLRTPQARRIAELLMTDRIG
ncbi:hypothetical protein ACIBLA_20670 [Streptomyces sp. NPDC050433]|uniref:hypothetical protein n=1 Tax=unclassified Streptomyces TaxID=2593676 RepID=UPI0034205FDF